MPFQIQIDAEIIRIIFSGKITKDEFIDLLKELTRVELDFECIPDRLTDMSGVTEWESGFTTMNDVAAKRRARVFPNKFKSAIVAPNPADYGIARMFQTLNDNPQIEIQIFKSTAEAEGWLALKS